MPATLVTGATHCMGPGIVRTLEHAGLSVIAVDPDSTTLAAATETIGRLGPVGALVTTGGSLVAKPFMEHEEDDWDATLASNLRAAFAWSRAVLPGMLERGSGSIVHVTSIAAFHYTTPHAAYAAAHAGLVAFTRDLAYEVAPHGVRVNAVAAGPVDVPIAGDAGERLAAATERAPLRIGRWGRTEDIGEAVAYLLSDRAGFITGETLRVAGGADLRVRRD
jgi:NAD(P)-dependent dehydrogenase (short-subunit alcohol dehydrogenase family)